MMKPRIPFGIEFLLWCLFFKCPQQEFESKGILGFIICCWCFRCVTWQCRTERRRWRGQGRTAESSATDLVVDCEAKWKGSVAEWVVRLQMPKSDDGNAK
jgi:hypothetical protein